MAHFAPNKLYITEKPAMAQALLAGLELAFGVKVVNNYRQDGYYRLSNGDAVAHQLGHLVEMVFLQPEHKAAKLGTYFDFLPIKVHKPEYRPRADTDKNGKPRLTKSGEPIPTRAYEVLMPLLRSCREIVNAGDIDREGQRIMDEIMEQAGIDPSGGSKPVWRIPLVSNLPQDIAKIVKQLERNSDPKWRLRGTEAFVRQLLDAATGFNGSMALQEVTGRHNMSVGRVQTPVLWIVYQRDLAIENFKPHDYFVPVITLADGTDMRWFKRAGCEGQPGFDAEGRIIDQRLAQAIVDQIRRGMQGRVTVAEKTQHSVAPPMPFTSASLASTVSKRYGMTPKDVEKIAQKLYEAKCISYIGTDCQFLPTSLLEESRPTVAALARLWPGKAGGADLSLRSKAWNDAKVEEHYAIVPTGKLPSGTSGEEMAVFETVAKRYLAQFYPDHQYLKHSLAAVFGGDEFRASAREVVRQGWKEVEGDGELGGRDVVESGDGEDDSDSAGQRGRAREVK